MKAFIAVICAIYSFLAIALEVTGFRPKQSSSLRFEGYLDNNNEHNYTMEGFGSSDGGKYVLVEYIVILWLKILIKHYMLMANKVVIKGKKIYVYYYRASSRHYGALSDL